MLRTRTTRAGRELAARPSPTGADRPGALAKRCLFGRHLSLGILPQKHHPWFTLTPLKRTTQDTDRRDARRQPTGGLQHHLQRSNTSALIKHLYLAGLEGGLRQPRKPPSLAKGKEILSGAFNSVVTNPPLLPTAIQPLPTL